MIRTLPILVLTAGWLGFQTAGGQATAPAASEGWSPPGSGPMAAADPTTESLRRDLRAIIARPGWKGDSWSVMVRSLDHGDILFSYGGTEPLAPASNMKLFTTAAALYYLGPDFRYNTFLMSTGPIRDGVLTGDLVVYGTGDPTLSARFGSLGVWESFADTLAALGVREITGNVVGDGSYFTGPGAGTGWQASYMNASYAATAGALSYAENVATLEIAPGEQTGWRPTVRLVPGGEGVAIVNQATTVSRGTTRISATRVAYDGPIVVRGQIALGAKPVVRTVPVSDPERFAVAVFRDVLLKRGITVRGTVASAHTSEESPVTGRSVFAPALDSRAPVLVLAVHTSAPLIDVLTIINKKSHNLMAEQVLRTVGRVAAGEGSIEGGRRAVEHMLESEGFSTKDIEQYDGSGLSVLNRVSAGGIIEVLALMANSPMWEYYWQTLPEAGARDGLRRMHRTPAQGNLRAKTGTIDHVSALSGYVTAANGERLAFSIISNNVPSTWMAKRVEDAIGERLAQFQRPNGAPASAPLGSSAPATGGTEHRTAPAAPERGSAESPASADPSISMAGPAPAPTAATAMALAAEQRHTIRSGETLDALSRQYGTSVESLLRANPGVNPRRLIPGQVIRIP